MNANKLCVPEKVLDQHLVILGKTGAGKSSALRHFVEHLLSEGKRVCVIDPKGDWGGLKTSADGKAGGFPVVGFGDFKNPKATDVPLNDQSGKHVAELVASGNRPCIIGFRGWMTSHMVKFWIDFASTLFSHNAGELYLVVDEFHNFAPKGKIMDPQAGMCLHWSNRLLSEGRGLGIVCLTASQRPQKVHNDSLTSHETLVAMRVIHAADRNAIKDWIDGCGDAERGKEVLASLASLKRGEAFVWSPEIGFGPKRITFPMFVTFDSFAPPQLQKKVSQSGWADVSLDDVKLKMAAVIEEAKANDPKELKKQIAELRKQLQSRPKESVETIVEKIVEVPVLKNGQLERTEKAQDRLEKYGQRLLDEAAKLRVLIAPAQSPRPQATPARIQQAPKTAPIARSVQRTIPPKNSGAESAVGKGGLRRILICLAQRPGLTDKQIGVRAKLSSSSGTFGTYMSSARSNGWISDSEDGKGNRFITDAGLEALGAYDPLPTGPALLSLWLAKLGNSGASRILTALVNAYPDAMTNEQIGEAADISSESGTFGTYMSTLRTLDLVQSAGKGFSKASDELFEGAPV